ncbi:MAG: helix-turn-helix transcriptional regulator [Phyllobacterium sp.]
MRRFGRHRKRGGRQLGNEITIPCSAEMVAHRVAPMVCYVLFNCAPCPTLGALSTPCTTLGIMPISSAQCRAGRALVEMDQAKLAEAANVSRNTVVDFERGRRTPNTNNLLALQKALETAGVIFVDENGEGPGVRLRKEAR